MSDHKQSLVDLTSRKLRINKCLQVVRIVLMGRLLGVLEAIGLDHCFVNINIFVSISDKLVIYYLLRRLFRASVSNAYEE